jgi:hypothetical protein
MLRRGAAVAGITGLFAAALLSSLVTHSTGVVRNDPERNIWIPDQLTMPLELRVAYNDQQIFFHYRWPAERPHVYTDLLRYSGGQWQRRLQTPIGSDPEGLYEDRLAMVLDDGSVPEFQRYGGYIAVHAHMRDFTGSGPDAAHRRKYLPATRKDPDDWYSIKDEATLDAQRRAGYFLDLWQWRAHLSNPLNRSDDQNVAWYRLYDTGDTLFFSNWDFEERRPRWMFDPAGGAGPALRLDELTGEGATSDEPRVLREGEAMPFDPEREWREGDVLPGQVLRESPESRGEIRVQGIGRWADAHWDVTLVRSLDTGHPLEDKVLRDQGVYSVAFSVHRDARTSRWHYVSLPLQVGLGRPAADVVATRFTSARHAGSKYIAKGVPVKYRHNEGQLARYGVEMEFDAAIRRQW